jgi:plasmid maintenance system antidote protein VapI
MIDKWNIALMEDDMLRAGWNKLFLAKRIKRSPTTVTLVFTRKRITAKTAAAIAKVLGHPVSRYFVTNPTTGERS